jgi:hypothetical protein
MDIANVVFFSIRMRTVIVMFKLALDLLLEVVFGVIYLLLQAIAGVVSNKL